MKKKPINPYKQGSLIWSVFEGEWEDLTASQIAEVLDATPMYVQNCIQKIRKDTGYDVPRKNSKIR